MSNAANVQFPPSLREYSPRLRGRSEVWFGLALVGHGRQEQVGSCFTVLYRRIAIENRKFSDATYYSIGRFSIRGTNQIAMLTNWATGS